MGVAASAPPAADYVMNAVTPKGVEHCRDAAARSFASS
ncbi:hypothetical protein FRUB_10173 [Fimbriiglobus ruber]|uniref:Uncharacterized protein n=1 Tax=Fimbriiglobus ruber TaxID=1908690 RepID=A0A225DCS6_9BACT|nr:hypothetical protein FRUB_10166 [Fimbriiglobus ruber]OWK34202.1 hypothetical protein FRUB_10173 [Fimbriiglobus ruber]